MRESVCVTEVTEALCGLRLCRLPSLSTLMFCISGVRAAELPGAVTGAVLLSGPAAVRQPLPHRHRSSKHGPRAPHG